MITLIVARSRNGAIGRDGDMPWHLPEDLAFFQRETKGGAVIMGRRTWFSLPEQYRPLKNRLNLVVTREAGLSEHTFTSIEDAIAAAQAHGHRRIYGMGGGQLYRAMMPLADRLLITEVDVEVGDADTYFPEFGEDNWKLLGKMHLQGSDPKCVVHEYFRR